MNKADVDNHTYVVILNAYAATQLIGRTNCVGESISLDGKKYQIIGVLQDEQSGISSTQSERMEAYIHFTDKAFGQCTLCHHILCDIGR